MKRILNGLGALALSGAVLLPAALTGAALLGFTMPAAAQGLWYKEVEKDGRIYVFNTDKKYKEWLVSNDMGVAITMLGQGSNGETVVAENETAIDLYNLKHDRPGYSRPAPKPAAAAGLPTAIKIGSEGELKFGLLLQAWYILDDSPFSTAGGGNSTLGNNVGSNTFRLRRAEIKLNGKINRAWGFEVMLDPSKAINPQTAGTDAKILQDLAVTFLGFKGHELALGQKKITLTEEGVRSSSELDFAERSQIIRAISDRRETGFFYKGDVAEPVTIWASITNGVASNILDDSNDTVAYSGRLDLKFVPGLIFGASGSYSGGETIGHLGRQRLAAHARYGGVAGATPLILEAEYAAAKDARAGAHDLRRDGWYAQALYTFDKTFQLGVRYDTITRDLDAQNGENGVARADAKTKTFTAGIHWLVQGKNLNIKLDYFNVKEDNRKVNGVLNDSYSQFVLAAQAAF